MAMSVQLVLFLWRENPILNGRISMSHWNNTRFLRTFSCLRKLNVHPFSPERRCWCHPQASQGRTWVLMVLVGGTKGLYPSKVRDVTEGSVARWSPQKVWRNGAVRVKWLYRGTASRSLNGSQTDKYQAAGGFSLIILHQKSMGKDSKWIQLEAQLKFIQRNFIISECEEAKEDLGIKISMCCFKAPPKLGV